LFEHVQIVAVGGRFVKRNVERGQISGVSVLLLMQYGIGPGWPASLGVLSASQSSAG
jgi:hypothetical protein